MREPDNTYFGGALVSWDGQLRLNQATFGVIQPGWASPEEITAADGGEVINLYEPTDQTLLELTVSGETEPRTLSKDNSSTTIPGGAKFLIRTGSEVEVAYTCEYPGRPAAQGSDTTEFIHRLTTLERRVGITEFTFSGTRSVKHDRVSLYRRLSAIIGETPLITLLDTAEGRIIAKVEASNPTESHYDRAFWQMFKDLESANVITPGKTKIIEVTSGSGGRSFAWLANRLDFKAQLIVPPEIPEGRLQDIRNLGAEVYTTMPGYMSAAAEEYGRQIRELSKNREWGITRYTDSGYNVFVFNKGDEEICYLNHSANSAAPVAFEGLVNEISVDEQPDFIISVLGNGTSTVGMASAAKSRFPNAEIIGIEDARSPDYFNRFNGENLPHSPHDMFGSSANGVPLHFQSKAVEMLNGVILIDPVERDQLQQAYNAVVSKRRVPVSGNTTTEHRIGRSSAASLVAAKQVLRENPGATVLVVIYDRADQYEQRGKHRPIEFAGLWAPASDVSLGEGQLDRIGQLLRVG